MGWFWGSNDDDDGKKGQDPLRDLDPDLQKFLRKESPVKYTTTAPPSPPPSTSPIPSPSAPAEPQKPKEKPLVPPESLFQDGRYAHLWKNYTPQREIDEFGKTDQEKILDAIDGFKQRKAEIGQTALENCALEQSDITRCFNEGGWQARMTLCRTEQRRFERCYMMQSKFLKALGYLSQLDRAPEVDEAIQMHADTIYHKMLAQEAAIKAAKEQGIPEPKFPPLLSNKMAPIPGVVDGSAIDMTKLPPSSQAAYKERLDAMETDTERELEEQTIKAELAAANQMSGFVTGVWAKQDKEREERKKEGKATFSDRAIDLLRFRPAIKDPAKPVESNPRPKDQTTNSK